MKHLIGALVASTIVVLGPTAGPALACRPVSGASPNPCAPYMPPPIHKHHHEHRVLIHQVWWR